MNRLPRPARERVRAPRVSLDITVQSKTIGTEAAFKMLTVDISKSGLLLSWSRHSHMPFLKNTILELTIDPDGTHLQRPVTCLGKVVRRDESDFLTAGVASDWGAEIGIQIVQIETEDLESWERSLSKLERDFGTIEIPDRLPSPPMVKAA